MDPSKIAFIFPGQGAQYPGMGKDIYDGDKKLSEYFDHLCSKVNFDLKKICFEGPVELLSRTDYSQPAIFAVSLLCLKYFENSVSSFCPVFTAGLSLGEYAALVASRVLTPDEGMNLVAKRARLMHEAGAKNPGRMASVIGLDEAVIQEICSGLCEGGNYVCVANLNCPGQIVVSGSISGLEKFQPLALSAGARQFSFLKVSGAFHSDLMKDAVEEFSHVLSFVDFKTAKIPVISNVTADVVRDKAEYQNVLASQLSSPVLWQASVERMIRLGVETFVQMGPGKILKGLIRRIDKRKSVINVECLNDLQQFQEWLK